MWDEIGWFSVLIISLMIGSILGILSMFIIKFMSHEKCETVTVLKVGGCGRYGGCGVMTDRGQMTLNTPVEGGKYFINCRNVWN